MLGLSHLLGKDTVVGIDIGSRFIKAVQAEAGSASGTYRITKAGVVPTPPDSVRDGVIVDSDAVAASIRDLFHTAGIEATTAVAAISGTSVIVRHVKLPIMAENILRKSIRYEASKYISSSMEGSLIEFEISGPVPGETDKMGVMLVAAPNDMVESRLTAIATAGLEPIAIDVESFASQRALLDLSPTKPTDGITLALVDIGAVKTDVNIVTNGRFALTRNIAIAGDNFTTALKTVSRSAEWHDLEALKKKVNMASMLDTEADPETLNLARAVQPIMDELLREVRRSMNYYQSQLTDASNSNLPAGISAQTGAAAVSQVIITGGSANMQGLEAYMSARLGVPVEAWNVFNNPAYDASALSDDFCQENHALLTTGIGLALKELTEAATKRAGKVQSAPTQQSTEPALAA